MEVDDAGQAEGSPASPLPPPENESIGQPKNKTTAKPTVASVREMGKSLLPISRVQKIMKADKVCSYHALHPLSSSMSC